MSASGTASSGKDQDSESKELKIALRPSERSSQLLVGIRGQETGRDPLFRGLQGEALNLHGVWVWYLLSFFLLKMGTINRLRVWKEGFNIVLRHILSFLENEH